MARELAAASDEEFLGSGLGGGDGGQDPARGFLQGEGEGEGGGGGHFGARVTVFSGCDLDFKGIALVDQLRRD